MPNGRKSPVFLKAALFVLLGIQSSPNHMFGNSPDAQVLAHPREIRPQFRLSGKPFVPATPRKIELTFHTLDTGMYTKTESIPEYSPVECYIPPIPDPRLPENRVERTEADTIPPISRRPDNRISLTEEMATLNDLDIGKAGGMVRWKDRRGMKMDGFLDIPMVWGEDYSPPMNGILRDDREYYFSGAISLGGSAIRLAEAVNRYTGLSARAGRHLYLGSHQLLKTPFLFMTADRLFELTGTERRNLGYYLSHGGFLFMDNAAPVTEWGPAETSMKKMVRDALGARARFQPIPISHPVYHSFFDFEDCPPQGTENGGFNPLSDAHNSAGYPSGPYMRMSKPVYFLEGVYLGDELVAVYSNKGYSLRWNRMTNNTPQMKFGINLVIYALTREGGMNERTMEWYSDIP